MEKRIIALPASSKRVAHGGKHPEWTSERRPGEGGLKLEERIGGWRTGLVVASSRKKIESLAHVD